LLFALLRLEPLSRYTLPVPDDLLRRLEAFSPWARSLIGFSDEAWLAPMAPGKWSVAECLAHLYLWDRFALTSRLPLLNQDARLPLAPTAQAMNNFAANYARTSVNQTVLIEQFSSTRLELVNALRDWPPEQWQVTFLIGKEIMTPRAYLEEFLKHNDHHRAQIERFWKSLLSGVD
jgi:uncharacterized damage-inducible protein DinB